MNNNTLKESVIKKFNKKFTASKNGDWVSSEDGDLYTGEDFCPFIEEIIQQAKEERDEEWKKAINSSALYHLEYDKASAFASDVLLILNTK